MRRLTLMEKASIEASVVECLKTLGLTGHFKHSTRAVSSGGFVLVVAPIHRKIDPTVCQALTMRGRHCRLEPAEGEDYCPTHLTLMKEDDDAI